MTDRNDDRRATRLFVCTDNPTGLRPERVRPESVRHDLATAHEGERMSPKADHRRLDPGLKALPRSITRQGNSRLRQGQRGDRRATASAYPYLANPTDRNTDLLGSYDFNWSKAEARKIDRSSSI